MQTPLHCFICGHVHDELIIECRKDVSLNVICEQMGKTHEVGTDNMQWFYDMKCLKCGHTYKANGTDIFQRKCLNCQGGGRP